MNTQTLITQIQQGFAPQWLHFWGHTPSKDGSLGKTCFSQWWTGHPFQVDSIPYATAEHYMMAEKARLFGDNAVLQQVLAASTPAIAKKLGREVKNFDDTAWCQRRWDIVVSGNFAKFSQHAELRDFLLNTGDRIIVEASPFDRIWGIGMAASDVRAENPAQWKGLNLLGFALMDVRQRLKEGQI